MRWSTVSLLCLSGFLQAYAMPKAGESHLVGTPCSGQHQQFTCQSVSGNGCPAPGKSVPGFCKGSADIQCCVQPKAAATGESHLERTPCSGQHQQFTCQSVSGNGCPAPGKFVPGFCKGSANIQCCVQPKGTSPGTGTTQQPQPAPQITDTTFKDDLEEEDCDEVPPQQPGGTNAPAQPGNPNPNPASPPATGTPPQPKTPPKEGKQLGSDILPGAKKSATAIVLGSGVLRSVQHSVITGTLPLFHQDFVPSVLKLIDCLPEGKTIYSTSSSRTFNNPSSNHRAGMAWDTNLMDDVGICDRDCMFSARKSGTGPFGWFQKLVQCAENGGVRHLGSQPAFDDGVINEEGHFEIDDEGKWSERNAAIQGAMKQWCSNKLPFLPPRVGDNASNWACRGV